MKSKNNSLLRGRTFLPILLAGAVASATLSAAFAAEITAEQAADAVQAWIDEGSSMGRLADAEVDSAATVETASGSRLHVVKLAGGGFVITSADDRVDPVIAFSPSGTNLVQDAANPFWALLSGDIAARERAAGVTASPTLRTTKASGIKGDTPTSAQARWASLLEKAAAKKSGTVLRGAKTTRSAGTVSDIRVDSFVQSTWDQETHNGLPNGLTCYNYYTPNNYVCGCVATAGAQLMRYWQWPTNSVTPLTKTCQVDGSNVSKTMQGGIYDWSSMPLVPANGVTVAQRQAIGKLTYDIGVAVQMDWESGGSGANTFALVPRFTSTFGYANAAAAVFQSDVYPYSLTEFKKAVIPNCDARSPMAMSISYVSNGFTYGHAAVVDGYGFSGNDFFIHVNLGWSGYNDAWYIPPDIDDFDTIDGLVFNVFPQSTGSIVSGRVLDAGGAPIANAAVHLQQGSATVASTTSDANGIYAFIASAGSYVVTADVLEGGVAVATASLGVQLATTTGTRQTDNGNWYTDSAASIGNSYDNDISITGVAAVPAPVFSPESCLFYPSTNVTITCADTDAAIHYTLDGSAPDQTSPLYTGPIFVDDTVTIRARAFATGKNPSAIVGATYTYDDSAGPPKGDYFADPIKISGASGTRVIEDNSRYTVEQGEPLHTKQTNGNGYTWKPQGRTIWYQWTAPGSGTMTFQTSAHDDVWIYPTHVAVYTGDSLASATRLAFSAYQESTYATTLAITVEQGVTYRVVGMLDRDVTDSGPCTFTLNWSGELYIFNSTTTTDLGDSSGWACGYVPVGEDVTISGAGVNGVMSATTPAFASITVCDGATLTLANGVTASNITLSADATFAVAPGATAMLANDLAATATAQAIPIVSIPSGATLQVPGGFAFKNVMLRMDSGTLTNDGTGALTLGTASANETAFFGLVATGSTISTQDNKALHFINPASGGTVMPAGDLVLTNCVLSTVGGSISFGVNNPTNTPFAVRCHETSLGITSTANSPSSSITFAGAGTVALSGGARLYRVVPSNPQYGDFTPTFQDRGRLTITDTNPSYPVEFYFPFCNNGKGRIVSTPAEDGFTTVELTGTRAWIWNPRSNNNSGSNGKAVWRIANSSLAFNMTAWWGQQQVPFYGLKAVEIAEGTTLTLERRQLGGGRDYNYGDTNFGGNGDASGEATICLADVPFTGGGSLIVTNTYNKDFHILVNCGANTATGIVAACDFNAANAGKTKILFNDGANWAGTVVVNDNFALVKNSKTSLNDKFSDSGEPATVSFGGVRLDSNLAIRLWPNGSSDQVNIGSGGFSGNGTYAFVVQDNYDPVPGDRWTIGTLPADVSLPSFQNPRWRLTTEAIAGDADHVDIILTATSVEYTFNSTTTTSLTNAAGWACGYVPVGEDVAIAGNGVTAVLDSTNSLPPFNSITVRDGASFRIAASNDLPAVTLRTGTTLSVAGTNAIAVFSSLDTQAPSEGAEPAVMSVSDGATAILPGGAGLKNIALRLASGTLMNDGTGPLYLGTAESGETAVFGLVATNSTIATQSNTALYFMSPENGGTVAPLDDLALTNSVVNSGVGSIHFGLHNPTNTPFTVRFHGTDLAMAVGMSSDTSSSMTFAGAGTVALTGGARFYRTTPYNPQNGAFAPTFQDRGRLTITGTNTNSPADFRYPFCGNGYSAIVSKPDEDGFATIEFTNARAWVWQPRPNYNTDSNGKAVWKVADSSFAYGMVVWWASVYQQVPFHGLKNVEIADGTSLTLVRRKLGSPWDYGDTSVGSSVEDASGSYTIRLANVPFTGGGSVVVTNTYDKDFHVLVTCGANTATGTIAAYDTSAAYAGKTKILFNDGANWAGAVVANGHVALVKNGAQSLNDSFADSGDPATVSFGGVRFDGDLTLRLWGDGSADQVNFGSLGFSGPGGIAFAFPDGTMPERGKWLIGTKPKSVPVPPSASPLWRISAKTFDETTDQLIASPVTGFFIIVK